MDIQNTVVEMFRDKRIDKAAAYQLLAECRKHTPATPAGPADAQATCELPRSEPGDPEAIASWTYLLHVVSGQTEVGFDLIEGTPIESTRRIALRVHVDDQCTAQQLRDRIAAQIAQAVAVETPAAFAWIAACANDDVSRRITATCIGEDQDANTVRLKLRVQPGAEGATRVEDWPDTLQQFHRAMWTSPDTRLAELELLPERHQRLLQDHNATAMYLPPTRTLPGLLDPVLAIEQDAIAVKTSRAQLDYASYRCQAYRIAHLLRRLGVQRNECVGVLLHRTAVMPAALYGVVCSGAAYVPLEPDMPADRLKTILRDANIRVVVTESEVLFAEQAPLADSGIEQIVCVDTWTRARSQGVPVHDAAVLAACPEHAPPAINAPEDLCYVIYTSGSTGKPKGVMISHLNLVNTLIGVNNVFNVGCDDQILCFSSYGFDLSVWDIFGAALAGATVFIPTKLETRDPAVLLEIVRDTGITIWDSVPTGMAQLLQPLAGQEAAAIPALRLAMLGGEFLQLSLVDDIRRVFPNCRVANLGGATEGSVWSIHHYPVDGLPADWKVIPYGTPLPNQRFHVLNESLRPCPIGQKGMLYIGGLGVAQGYLGDQTRTQAAFVAAPWPGEPGGRIYRTGDLGIMHADGRIEICGRADHQIKIRGFRVELGEIESRFGAIDGIDQGVVVAKLDDNRQYRLVAFYVSRRGEVPAERLRAALLKDLPEYMIPSQFVHLSDPPVGATGKLDRKALEEREVSRNEVGQTYVKPRDQTDEQLAVKLAQILRLDRVGLDDDFFLIGGDSLLTLQYIAALSQLGLKASPLDIQQGRTIRGVLEQVRDLEADHGGPEAELVPFGPMSRKFFERLPLVERNHWNQLMVIGFDHRPDIERLRAAMTAVVNHHPALRSSHSPEGLKISPRATFELPVIDLSGVPTLLRSRRFQEQAVAMHRTVGLDSACLANAMLVQLSPKDCRLIWVLHHLVVDANCWRILVEDLATAYRQPGMRLLRSASMADFVGMVREASPAAAVELVARPRYERMAVPGIPATTTPQTGLERDGRTLRAIFSADETRVVLTAARTDGGPNLNLLLLTALTQSMRDWSGSSDIRFDVISNGRSVDPSRDYSRTIGWFATHNPFEVELSADAGQALETVGAAWQHYQRNSRFFVEVCNDLRDDDAHPLGRHVDQPLLYSFLGDFDSLSMPDGWNILGTAGRNRAGANPRTHELEMETMVARGRLMVRLVCGNTFRERRQANRLLSHFRQNALRLARGSLSSRAQ